METETRNGTGRSGLRALAACLCAALTALGCGAERQETADDTILALIETFSMNRFSGEEKRWTLKGELAEIHEKNRIVVHQPQLTLYEEGEAVCVVTGDMGDLDEKSGDMKIHGNVRAVSDDGEMFSDQLLWNEEDGTLVSPEDVELRRGDSTVWAKSMESDPNLSKVKLLDATFQLRAKDETIEPYLLEPTDP